MKYFIVIFLIMSMLFTFGANATIKTITIKDGAISTTQIMALSSDKIEFKIKNLDKNFESFKSKSLNLEIDHMPLGSEIAISIPTLNTGIYPFKVAFKNLILRLADNKEIHGNLIVK